MKSLRFLVWVYFWLLLFEGALRKWIFPSLNAELLLIRDPVVLLIYFQALRHGLSFRGGLIAMNTFLAVSTSITAILFGYATGYANILVTIYGFLANYFQIPLIFLIPQILDRDDVLRMGKYLLWLVIPMTLLTVLQFKSDPGSVWNKGAMTTHYSTVRPSGTFSFNNGLAYYFAFTSAFLFFGYLHARTYKLWLLWAATLFMLVAAGCSGSRTCVISIGLVLAVAVLCVVLRGRKVGSILVAAVLVGLAVMVVSSMSVVNTGTEQLEQRFVDAGATEGGAQGFAFRFLSTFLSAFVAIPLVPFFGYGLGTGTNGAAALLDFSGTGMSILWVENEWERWVVSAGRCWACCFVSFGCADVPCRQGGRARVSPRQHSFSTSFRGGRVDHPEWAMGRPGAAGFRDLRGRDHLRPPVMIRASTGTRSSGRGCAPARRARGRAVHRARSGVGSSWNLRRRNLSRSSSCSAIIRSTGRRARRAFAT